MPLLTTRRSLISVAMLASASTACKATRDSPAPAASYVSPFPSASSAPAASSAQPVVLSGVAVEQAAEYGAGSDRKWVVWFCELRRDQKPGGSGWPTKSFVASALQSEGSAWRKIGPGDRVTFECELRTHVVALWRCKLTAFEDTSYDLGPMPEVLGPMPEVPPGQNIK